MLGIDASLRDLADLVTGAADALQAARDRARRLDQQHQIDRAHVDAELETRRRDDAADAPRLQRLLDLAPLLVRDAAVVREQDLLARELVEPLAEPLAEPARVHEQDRRAVREHLLEQPRMDRRPQPQRRIRHLPSASSEQCRARVGWFVSVVVTAGRRRGASCRGPARRSRGRGAGARWCRRSRPADRRRGSARPPRAVARSRRARCAADRAPVELRDALERQREVRAALGRRERVDLVDDHRLDAAQRLALRRAEHQVERLGRRDEDLGGIARLLAPLARGRVAGAHVDARHAHRQRRASPPRGARRRAARAGCARCRRPAP